MKPDVQSFLQRISTLHKRLRSIRARSLALVRSGTADPREIAKLTACTAEINHELDHRHLR